MAVSTNICDKYKLEIKNEEQVASRQNNLKAKLQLLVGMFVLLRATCSFM